MVYGECIPEKSTMIKEYFDIYTEKRKEFGEKHVFYMKTVHFMKFIKLIMNMKK